MMGQEKKKIASMTRHICLLTIYTKLTSLSQESIVLKFIDAVYGEMDGSGEMAEEAKGLYSYTPHTC